MEPQFLPCAAHVCGAQPGLMVRFLLAESVLHAADAETVTWSCEPTVKVESVTEVLLAPRATVAGPVQTGDPVQPGKVASCVPDRSPSLTRIDTVAVGSLPFTA